MRLVKDQKGDVLVFVAIILPIILFILNFTLTYGIGEYAKSTVITASREAARTYAVKHDADMARESARTIVEKTFSVNENQFNPETDIVLTEDGDFATATVTYRVPVAVPAMMRLIGVNTTLGKYMPVSSTARFIKEAVPGD
ncbi:TadE/TadG family type IV pilus assembly protein [Pelotomaculum propionicicum]|uniref:TadE/TadG family type IV pilus assembly protein n=1 Tax=Pelotomaculum propionicicum TaxID=258475 RepID=UPI003B808E18